MTDELKKIKKLYGEDMMKLCRALFPLVLETPGLLIKTLLENFDPTRFLYDDIVKTRQELNFYNFILEKANIIDVIKISINKTPTELLDEAGYILYECKNEQDIQSFKKYYQKTEELCTFRGGRLKSCHVFFAVKKNVDMIKR